MFTTRSHWLPSRTLEGDIAPMGREQGRGVQGDSGAAWRKGTARGTWV